MNRRELCRPSEREVPPGHGPWCQAERPFIPKEAGGGGLGAFVFSWEAISSAWSPRAVGDVDLGLGSLQTTTQLCISFLASDKGITAELRRVTETGKHWAQDWSTQSHLIPRQRWVHLEAPCPFYSIQAPAWKWSLTL